MWYCNACEEKFDKPDIKGKTKECPNCGSRDIYEICEYCDEDASVHCEDCGKPLCDDCEGREFGYGVYYCDDCRPVEDDGQR